MLDASSNSQRRHKSTPCSKPTSTRPLVSCFISSTSRERSSTHLIPRLALKHAHKASKEHNSFAASTSKPPSTKWVAASPALRWLMSDQGFVTAHTAPPNRMSRPLLRWAMMMLFCCCCCCCWCCCCCCWGRECWWWWLWLTMVSLSVSVSG